MRFKRDMSCKKNIDYKLNIVNVNIIESKVKSEAEIQIQDTLDRYKKYGIKYYEFCADTDDETCDICASLDGKKFKITKAKIGVNAPPMHDGCRCYIAPVVE